MTRALVELLQLEEEKAKRAAKAASAKGLGDNASTTDESIGEITAAQKDDAALATRIAMVRDGIYKRMKLLATWADLDDEQVWYCCFPRPAGSVPLLQYAGRCCVVVDRTAAWQKRSTAMTNYQGLS